MLIPSWHNAGMDMYASLSRRVNANSQLLIWSVNVLPKLIKKGEC